MRADASRHADQRRDDRVRRRRSTRACSTARSSRTRASSSAPATSCRPAVGRSRHRDPGRPDARRGRQTAAAVRAEGGGDRGRRRARRASSIRATCSATRSPSTTAARSRRRTRVFARRRAREHDLRREHDHAERPARGSAGRRRLAARRGHRDQLVRSHAAAAGPGRRHLCVGQSAVIVFQLRVNAGVPAGTLISNQGAVRTAELPDAADGRRRQSGDRSGADGGRGRQRAAAHDHQAGRGGRRRPGARRARRSSTSCASPTSRPCRRSGVVITRRPRRGRRRARSRYVAGSATLNGAATGVTVAGSLITADYSTTLRPAAAERVGRAALPRARSTPALATGTTITNTGVVTWNNPPQTASASVSIAVGGDAGRRRPERHGLARRRTSTTRSTPPSARSQGWIVELLPQRPCCASVAHGRRGRLQHRRRGAEHRRRRPLRAALPRAGRRAEHRLARHRRLAVHERSAADQRHRGARRAATSRTSTCRSHRTASCTARIDRAPIAGATLRLLNASGAVAAAALAASTTRCSRARSRARDGYYKFDLNFSDRGLPERRQPT